MSVTDDEIAAPAASGGEGRLDGKTTALALSLCFLWGGLTPAVKASLEGMPPFGLAAVRFALSWALIAAWCRLSRIDLAIKGDFFRLMALACVFVAQIFTLNIGATLTSASHAIIFLSTYPLFVGVLAHFFLHQDRMNRHKAAGLAAAFIGVAVTFGERRQPSQAAGLTGDLLVLLSGVLLAALVIMTKRMVARYDSTSLLYWQLLLGVPLFTLGTLLTEGAFRWHFSLPVLAGLAYQGVVISGLCFVVWNRLLQKHSASRLSAFAFTNPIFGVLLSWLIRHEPLTSGLVSGVGLVAVGIYLSNRSQG
ncbi:MAG: DMT family transporter [Armatimonadetes bacterium]|nr:DMT family transporter [Armatimonadota bacterium]